MRYVNQMVFLLSVSSTAFADQIPYTGGKLAGSFDITFSSSNAPLPTVIQIGNVVSFKPYWASNGLAVCSNLNEYGLQIIFVGNGAAYVRANRDTNWSSFTRFLSLSSDWLLDSVPKTAARFTSPSPLTKARGYIFAYPGDNQCMGPTYHLDSNYAQVVIMQASGVYVKMKIWSYFQTAGSSVLYPTKTLDKITLRYVISNNVNDLVDVPSAIHFSPMRRTNSSSNGFEFYSPSGKKVDANFLRVNIPALKVNSRTSPPVHLSTP